MLSMGCASISNFFWEAEIVAACSASPAVLTEVFGFPNKALVFFLCHILPKLAEMSLMSFMRRL